ncbi:MAG: nucleoside diphosphate kinase regulator [Gammaproteobacteria bacterium]|nr:nucleoside diphosphate kinase regulator [Gammaproteobacteria bacterium]
MENPPPIIVSSLDLQRLESLLDRPDGKRLPGVEALRGELDRATVVEPAEVPPEVVTMNSTVRFRDEATGESHELTLVYPEGGNRPGTISVLAPVGSALLGLSVGQTISWQIPGGRKAQLRILEILRQPEAMGEYHR